MPEVNRGRADRDVAAPVTAADPGEEPAARGSLFTIHSVGFASFSPAQASSWGHARSARHGLVPAGRRQNGCGPGEGRLIPPGSQALYRAFETPVYNLCRRICRTAEDAEDVLQETFLEICRSIRQYREDGSLWGWIRTIAASKALMRLRRNKYRDTDELNDEVVGQRREDTALRMDLEAALERLSETSRAVVWLHDVEGYTHEEIAAMMGKTASFSKSQLARAHARLRRWLGEDVAA